jgi:transcription initiation factor TFIIIB Brf1 subunit/transcription initiation factor TFIIB
MIKLSTGQVLSIDLERYPTSLVRHDIGLATTITNTDRDASGYKIDAAMRSTMNRLRIWN